MPEQPIIYFAKPGRANTSRVLKAAARRAEELGIRHAVVATTTGATAVKAAGAMPGVQVVGVHLAAGYWETYDPPDARIVRRGEKLGVRFHTATHTLMGNVDAAIIDQFGGITQVELIARTLYLFGQGMKVAVEVAVMAADAALIPVDRDALAIAGTGAGADTAIVLRPAYSRYFFKNRVKEILCKPRL